VYKFKPPVTTPLADFQTMLEISEEVIAFVQEGVHGPAARSKMSNTPVAVSL
jgi:hypothetical protein